MKEYQVIGNATSGSFRFNTDSSRLEIYNGEAWWEIDATSPELETGGARAVVMGGWGHPVNGTSMIGHINITTTGNEVDSGGDITTGYSGAGISDRTRGIRAGYRNDPSPGASMNTIEFVTISIGNDSIDFGDLLAPSATTQGVSSRTRGILAGGYENPAGAPSYPRSNTIQYVTIQTTGNAIDFGDMAVAATSGGASGQSPTRGLFLGGSPAPTTANRINTIQYLTMSTLGNTSDFGDLTKEAANFGGCSNAIRSLVSGGAAKDSTTALNDIEFVTIATLGNAQDFGDMTATRTNQRNGGASPTRAIFVGGYGSTSSPYGTNVIDYVEIMTTGNALDFGDLVDKYNEAATTISNGHGGLG